MKNNRGYSAIYDAIFYLDTRKWVEDKCGNSDCEFCINRPDTAEGLTDDHVIKQMKDKLLDNLE